MANVTNAVNAATIAKFYDAALLQRWRRPWSWRTAVLDLSAQFPYGDSLITSINDTAYTWLTHTDGLELADPTGLTIVPTTLTISQDRYLKHIVTDKQARQLRPDLIVDTGTRQAESGMRLINDYIRDGVVTTMADNANVGQRVADISVAAAGFGAAAHQKAVISALFEMEEFADNNFWPEEGRCVMVTPTYFRYCGEYLALESGVQWNTNKADTAFDTGNPPMMIAGWEIKRSYYEPNAAAILKTANSNRVRHPMYGFVKGSAGGAGEGNLASGVPGSIHFAEQLRTAESYRDQDYFGTTMRWNLSYGMNIPDAKRICWTATQIT